MAKSLRPDPDSLASLTDAALESRSDDITCDEWVDRVGALVEALARGGDLPSALAAVARHSQLCPQCAEEFEALRRALEETASSGPSAIGNA